MIPATHFRKLVAVDIVFLGYRLIFAEYACGVVFSIALGTFVLLGSHSFWQVALGMYLVSLGINYIPLLAFTVSLANRENARAELAEEVVEPRRAMSKYRRLSVLLLVPLAVPLLVAIGKR